MTTTGTLAWVASGAVASASGVRPKPGEDRDLVVDDQLLRQPLGDVGHAGVVLDDELDLLAGDRVAVLLHVELHGRLDLAAGRGERAGHRQDQADLHGVLRESAGGDRAKRGSDQEFTSEHLFSSQTIPKSSPYLLGLHDHWKGPNGRGNFVLATNKFAA